MKNQKVKCLGVEVSKSVPSTMEELGKLGLTEGQVVDTAVKHIMYHVFLGSVRDKVQERLEESLEAKHHRPFNFALGKDNKPTTAKVYILTIEKWLEELVASKVLDEKSKTEFVKAAVEEVKFEASKPREKKDQDLERRLGLVEKWEKLENWEELFAKKAERNNVEIPEDFDYNDREAVAGKILEIELAP
jgi:hypothetical protein